MRQEVVMRILRHLLVYPYNSLGSQLPNVMLELIPAPFLLLGEQSSRNEAIFAGQVQQDGQVAIELNGHGANIGVVNNRGIPKDIGLL